MLHSVVGWQHCSVTVTGGDNRRDHDRSSSCRQERTISYLLGHTGVFSLNLEYRSKHLNDA